MTIRPKEKYMRSKVSLENCQMLCKHRNRVKSGKQEDEVSLFERNADRLANANTIYEGQVIVLPAK